MHVSGPIITLTTDFGTRDHYVGAVKGVMLGICPSAVLVDISHDVPCQDVAHGSMVIGNAHGSFPPETVHLCVVDPGVGTDRRAVALITPRGSFVAPDNGILTRVIAALPGGPVEGMGGGAAPVPEGCRAYELSEPRFWRHPVSDTFHGRDVFGPVAAHLAAGTDPSELGSPVDRLTVIPEAEPGEHAGSITGSVIYVDTYGNLVTNVPAGSVAGRGLVVSVAGRRIEGPVRTFADGQGLIVLVGSFGYVEIALNGGSAARELGVGVGARVTITPEPEGLQG